jgi:hypothetical protein
VILRGLAADEELDRSRRIQAPLGTNHGFGRSFVTQQLQRYFTATIAVAVASVWTVAGAASGLTCLLVAGATYGATALAQPGVLGRIIEAVGADRHRLLRGTAAAPVRHARRRRPDVARRGHVRSSAPVRVLDDREPVAEVADIVEYGW